MDTIYITKADYDKLIDLLKNKYPREDADLVLLSELTRARIVRSEEIPEDIITMNTQVDLIDTETGSGMRLWLVFPKDANLSEGKISVLSPVGCALLGTRVGDDVELRTPAGVKVLKVEKILFQPEAAGNYN